MLQIGPRTQHRLSAFLQTHFLYAGLGSAIALCKTCQGEILPVHLSVDLPLEAGDDLEVASQKV